jgi:hypothetical protein
MRALNKLLSAGIVVLSATTAAQANPENPRQHSCDGLPSWATLQQNLASVVQAGGSGGLGFNMWATIVANDGTVCAVAFSGENYTNQWLASRVISAQKANTANGLSLGKNSNMPTDSLFPKGLALSTANLYAAVQPGGSLFGLQFSNPVDPDQAYLKQNGQPDDPATFGTARDPMVGRPIGGVNVFGGGLGLYRGGIKIGGVGVSGDTSCTDHFVAWKLRSALGLDHLGPVQGVSGDSQRPDNIVFDVADNQPNPSTPVQGGVGVSLKGFGHPKCLNAGVPASLPVVH